MLNSKNSPRFLNQTNRYISNFFSNQFINLGKAGIDLYLAEYVSVESFMTNYQTSQLHEFLKSRRSVMARNITTPGPTESQIKELIEIAARVPDHGKLAPWRFIVFENKARETAGKGFADIHKQNVPEASDEDLQLEVNRLQRAPLVIGVVASPKAHPKIPDWEQYLSAGAACLNLLTAAQSMGFAAQWLTEWIAYDTKVASLLGLNEKEKIAGFIYIGTAMEPPKERARPEINDVLTYWPSQ